MKTSFRILMVGIAALIFTMSGVARAERTVGWFLLGGDTFTLGNVAAGYQDFHSAQTREVDGLLVGSVPEQRDMEIALTTQQLSDFRTTGGDQWKGSTHLVIAGDDDDGYVKLDNSDHGVAYLPLINAPTLGGRFIVEGDVKVDQGDVASIGMLNTATSNGSQMFGSDGIASMWVRVAEKVGSASDTPDHYQHTYDGQTIAQICLMSGSRMLDRVYIPIDSNGVQIQTAEVPDFDYGEYSLGDLATGFDRVWLQWFPNTNTVDLKINNHFFLQNVGLSQFNVNNPQVAAMGFQLQGDGELSRFAATPEPSSVLMMCFGMLFFGLHTRRQRRRARKMGSMGLSLSMTP